MGFDVGHVFVTQVFSKQIKEAVTAMLDDVIHAFELRMHNITWLDADALKNAELKLHKITKFVGYPETWPQHNGVTLSVSTTTHRARQRGGGESWSKNVGKACSHIQQTYVFLITSRTTTIAMCRRCAASRYAWTLPNSANRQWTNGK